MSISEKRSAKREKSYIDDGSVVRLLLHRKKITQVQIAKRLRVTRATVTYWLNGKLSIDRPTRAALREILKIEDDSLYIRTESAHG
jgi:transcriptional regulator with XRE-family HTH domain